MEAEMRAFWFVAIQQRNQGQPSASHIFFASLDAIAPSPIAARMRRLSAMQSSEISLNFLLSALRALATHCLKTLLHLLTSNLARLDHRVHLGDRIGIVLASQPARVFGCAWSGRLRCHASEHEPSPA
jgi:hypothetical protein